jgi:DNA polymerase-1
MRQRFNDNPMTDLHGECAALMNVKRGPAKIINLAIWYGAQGANISDQLGLPKKTITTRRGVQLEVAGSEAQELLDRHFESLPFIKGFFEFARWSAEERGYVRALDGHRLRFEKYGDGNYVQTYKAANKIIQGSAAVQMKSALVALRRAGIPVNITVHDEADKSIPRGEEGERLKARMVEIMEAAAPISVPMIAEIKVGESWGTVE